MVGKRNTKFKTKHAVNCGDNSIISKLCFISKCVLE